MVQIGRYHELPVLHTVSLIDWATGGPMPAALRGVNAAGARSPNRKRLKLTARRRQRLGQSGVLVMMRTKR